MENIKPGDLCVVKSGDEKICFIVDEATPNFVSGTRVNLLQFRDDLQDFKFPDADSWAPYVKPKTVSALREQVKLCDAPLLSDVLMRQFARYEIPLERLNPNKAPFEIAVPFDFALTIDDLLAALRKIRDERDKVKLRSWALGFYQFLLPSVKKVIDLGGDVFIFHGDPSEGRIIVDDAIPSDVAESDEEDEETTYASSDSDTPCFPTEKSVLHAVCLELFDDLVAYAVLCDANNFKNDRVLETEKYGILIGRLIKKVETCVENRDLPPVKRYYEEEVKKNFVESFRYEQDLLRGEDLALFVRFVDELCEDGDRTAMEIKARACYKGNDAYRRDPAAARELLLRLTKNVDADTELFLMLGDLYHEESWDYERFDYGLARDGVRLESERVYRFLEIPAKDDDQHGFDKVFYYYSIAALGGDWNARLRLADMFHYGTYVPRNLNVYWSMIWKLYHEKFEALFDKDLCPKTEDEYGYDLLEKLENEYTEIAIRLGEACLEGIGIERSWEKAFFYYLQADCVAGNFALHTRIYDRPFGLQIYGEVLSSRAYKLVGETEDKASKNYFVEDFFKTKTLCPFLEGTTPKDSRFNVCVKKLNDEKYLLKLTSEPRNDRLKSTFLLTIPQLRYCGFVDNIILTLKPTEIDLKFTGDYASFSFDRYFEGGQFIRNEKEVARISGEFTWSENATFEDVRRKFVSVKFKSGYKTYDYLCDLDDVKVGDKVVVSTSHGNEVVEVQKVFERLDSDSPLPIGSYKKIIEKVDK